MVLPISKIRPWKDQPRKFFSKDAIKNLANSILEVGQKKPIDVMEDPDRPGLYIVVDGERRLLACQQLGRKTIMAIIVPQEDAERRLIRSVVCNFGSEKHTPYEAAMALRRIYETKKHTVPQIAAMFAKSACWAYQHLSLTRLDQRVVDMMDFDIPHESRLKFAIAILLVDLPGDLQFEIAKHIVDQKMSSKAARHHAEIKAMEKGHKVGGMAKKPNRKRQSLMSLFSLMQESLQTFTGNPHVPLEEFLSTFNGKDLIKLEEHAKKCQTVIGVIFDAIAPAKARVKAVDAQYAKRTSAQ